MTHAQKKPEWAEQPEDPTLILERFTEVLAQSAGQPIYPERPIGETDVVSVSHACDSASRAMMEARMAAEQIVERLDIPPPRMSLQQTAQRLGQLDQQLATISQISTGNEQLDQHYRDAVEGLRNVVDNALQRGGIEAVQSALAEVGVKTNKLERITRTAKTLVDMGTPPEVIQKMDAALDIQDQRRSELLIRIGEEAASHRQFSQDMATQAARLADSSFSVDMAEEERQFHINLQNIGLQGVVSILSPAMAVRNEVSRAFLAEQMLEKSQQQAVDVAEKVELTEKVELERKVDEEEKVAEVNLIVVPEQHEQDTTETNPEISLKNKLDKLEKEDKLENNLGNRLETALEKTEALIEVGYETARWLEITESHALAEFARGIVLGRENETMVFDLLPDPVQSAVLWLISDDKFRANAHGSDAVFKAHCQNGRTGAKTRIEATRGRLLRIPELTKSKAAASAEAGSKTKSEAASVSAVEKLEDDAQGNQPEQQEPVSPSPVETEAEVKTEKVKTEIIVETAEITETAEPKPSDVVFDVKHEKHELKDEVRIVKDEAKIEDKDEVKDNDKDKTDFEAKDKKDEPKPAISVEAIAEIKSDPKPELKPELKQEMKLEIKPEVSAADVKAELKPEVNSGMLLGAKPETEPEVKSEMKPRIKPELRLEIKPELKPEIKPEAKPEDLKPEDKPEVKTERLKPTRLKRKPPSKTASKVPGKKLAKKYTALDYWKEYRDEPKYLKAAANVLDPNAVQPAVARKLKESIQLPHLKKMDSQVGAAIGNLHDFISLIRNFFNRVFDFSPELKIIPDAIFDSFLVSEDGDPNPSATLGLTVGNTVYIRESRLKDPKYLQEVVKHEDYHPYSRMYYDTNTQPIVEGFNELMKYEDIVSDSSVKPAVKNKCEMVTGLYRVWAAQQYLLREIIGKDQFIIGHLVRGEGYLKHAFDNAVGRKGEYDNIFHGWMSDEGRIKWLLQLYLMKPTKAQGFAENNIKRIINEGKYDL